MRRGLARLRPLWLVLIPALIGVNEMLSAVQGYRAPPWLVLAVALALAGLILVTPPRTERAPVVVAAPVAGRWVALNSPGTKTPSHGTRAYGQTYAVDIVLPSGGTGTPPLVRRGLRGSRPEGYPSFGEPVHAVASGVVRRVVDWQPDHRARNTWPAAVFMLVVEGLLRSFGGFTLIGGNHVVITHDDGTSSAYAHLRRRSVVVRRGQRVQEGQPIAGVGNTGNTSEPHLHVQLMERSSPAASSGVPMLWRDVVTEDEADDRIARYATPPKPSAVAGFPPTAQVFHVPERAER